MKKNLTDRIKDGFKDKSSLSEKIFVSLALPGSYLGVTYLLQPPYQDCNLPPSAYYIASGLFTLALLYPNRK